MPNKAWMLHFLSTYASDDEIFKKSYVAPPIKEKKLDEKVIPI